MPVHDLVYRRLTAAERPGRRATWRPIADFALIGARRGWVYRLLKLAAYVPLVGAVFALYFLGQTGTWASLEGVDPARVREQFAPWAARFFGVQFFFMTFFAAVAGGPLVAEDLRRHALELYFSKPVRPVDYAFGKWAAVFLALATVMVVPLLGAGVALFGFVPGGFAAFGDLTLRACLAGAFAAAVGALVVLGVSAVGRSGRYAVVLWFVVSMFTHLAAIVLVAQTRDGRFAVASFRDSVRLAAGSIMNVPWDGETFSGEAPSPAAALGVLALWCAGAAATLYARLRKAATS